MEATVSHWSIQFKSDTRFESATKPNTVYSLQFTVYRCIQFYSYWCIWCGSLLKQLEKCSISIFDNTQNNLNAAHNFPIFLCLFIMSLHSQKLFVMAATLLSTQSQNYFVVFKVKKKLYSQANQRTPQRCLSHTMFGFLLAKHWRHHFDFAFLISQLNSILFVLVVD